MAAKATTTNEETTTKTPTNEELLGLLQKLQEDNALLKKAVVSAQAAEASVDLKKPNIVVENGKQKFRGMVR